MNSPWFIMLANELDVAAIAPSQVISAYSWSVRLPISTGVSLDPQLHSCGGVTYSCVQKNISRRSGNPCGK